MQGNRECDDMNSVSEKLKIVSEESGKKMFGELVILKPKILQAIYQILQRKTSLDTDYLYDFAESTCASNISKELIELIMEELVTQHVIVKKRLFKVLICFIN